MAFASLPLWADDIRMGVKPNPANHQAIISIEGGKSPSDAQPEIYTVLGEKVGAGSVRREGNLFIVNTAMIPDGVYLVKYTSGNQTVVKRLRIQH